MSRSTVFERKEDGRVKFTAEAVEVLLTYRQVHEHDAEAGGVLYGRYIRNTHDIVIDGATSPTHLDQRFRLRFLRSSEGHQRVLDRLWEESRGAINFLGEWHTHPEPHPSPSAHDLSEWRRLVRECCYEGSGLLFAIMGTRSCVLWEVSRSCRTVHRLNMSPNSCTARGKDE